MCPHDSNSADRPPEGLQWSPPQHENRILGYHARMVSMNNPKPLKFWYMTTVPVYLAAWSSGPGHPAGGEASCNGPPRWTGLSLGRELCFARASFPMASRASLVPPLGCAASKKAIGMISSQNKYPFQYSFPPQLLTLLISGILKVSELSIRGYGPLRHLNRNPNLLLFLFVIIRQHEVVLTWQAGSLIRVPLSFCT